MTEIKRYEMNHKGLPEPDDKGVWVFHEDHAAIGAAKDARIAALQEQLSSYSMSAGQSDQRKAESDAVRVALGFTADADDVSPSDLLDKLAALQEQVRALAAERDASRKAIAEIYMAVIGGRPGWSNWHAYLEDIVEEVATVLSEIRAQARAEGIHFAANRLLAAWESGFVDDTPAAAHDISGAILSAVEFLPNADEAEFKRDYADEVRARIRVGEQP